MLHPVTVIGPGRTRCHRCGSPNLYRDYTAGGEVLACLMCGERMEPGRNERHGGVLAPGGGNGRRLRPDDTQRSRVGNPAHAVQMNTKGALATEPKRNLWGWREAGKTKKRKLLILEALP